MAPQSLYSSGSSATRCIVIRERIIGILPTIPANLERPAAPTSPKQGILVAAVKVESYTGGQAHASAAGAKRAHAGIQEVGKRLETIARGTKPNSVVVLAPNVLARPRLEYFCNESDKLWSTPDAELIQLGREELHRIGLIDSGDVLDGTVIRMEKTYPAYFGSYDRFDEIRAYVDGFENLFLLGRNGMHRYNNQDHSMLTAMVAVDNILAGETGKANLWDINTEQDYHEEAKASAAEAASG